MSRDENGKRYARSGCYQSCGRTKLPPSEFVGKRGKPVVRCSYCRFRSHVRGTSR